MLYDGQRSRDLNMGPLVPKSTLSAFTSEALCKIATLFTSWPLTLNHFENHLPFFPPISYLSLSDRLKP